MESSPSRKLGKRLNSSSGGYKSKDGISQELHLLVVAHARAAGRLQGFQLACLGAVGQGLLQQFGRWKRYPRVACNSAMSRGFMVW